MKTLNVFAELNELRKNWRDWSVIFRAPTPKFQNLFMNMTKNQEFFFYDIWAEYMTNLWKKNNNDKWQKWRVNLSNKLLITAVTMLIQSILWPRKLWNEEFRSNLRVPKFLS